MTHASFHIFIPAFITVSQVSARAPVFHLQTGLYLGLVEDRQPPQTRDKFRVVPLEVCVVKVVKLHLVRVATVSHVVIGFLEAVQIELTDKAGEVGRFESVFVVQGTAAATAAVAR